MEEKTPINDASDLIMDDKLREVDKAGGEFSDYLSGKKKEEEKEKKENWGDVEDMEPKGDNDFIPGEPSKEFFTAGEGHITNPLTVEKREEVEEPEEDEIKEGKFPCKFCGKKCKSLAGEMAHERKCKKKEGE